MLFSDIFTKINDMETYAVSQTSGCGIDEAISVTFYNQKFNELRAAIINYQTSAQFIQQRDRDLRAIIMAIYQKVVMENIVTDAPIITHNEGSAPLGYSDLSLLFNVNGVGDAILAASVSSGWQGCVSGLGGAWVKDSWITDAEDAEAAEVTKRLTLNHWVQSTNVYNAFVFLFEEVLSATAGELDKAGMAEDIYLDRKAKEVIEEFNLNVYVPTTV